MSARLKMLVQPPARPAHAATPYVTPATQAVMAILPMGAK